MRTDYWTFSTQGMPTRSHLIEIGKQLRKGIFTGVLKGLGWWGVNTSCELNTNGTDYIVRMIEEGRYTGEAFPAPSCMQCVWLNNIEEEIAGQISCRYDDNTRRPTDYYCRNFRCIRAENMSR